MININFGISRGDFQAFDLLPRFRLTPSNCANAYRGMQFLPGDERRRSSAWFCVARNECRWSVAMLRQAPEHKKIEIHSWASLAAVRRSISGLVTKIRSIQNTTVRIFFFPSGFLLSVFGHESSLADQKIPRLRRQVIRTVHEIGSSKLDWSQLWTLESRTENICHLTWHLWWNAAPGTHIITTSSNEEAQSRRHTGNTSISMKKACTMMKVDQHAPVWQAACGHIDHHLSQHSSTDRKMRQTCKFLRKAWIWGVLSFRFQFRSSWDPCVAATVICSSD